MCGHVGIITKTKSGFMANQLAAFSQLLYAGYLRGQDGVGVYYNSKQGRANVRILKGATEVNTLLENKEYKKAESIVFKESNFFFGHNRSATKGEIDNKSTHPFRSKHIVLAHNGTLSSFHDLFPKEINITVDSEAIAYSMAAIGEKETIKKLDGAFALVWTNSQTNKINLCRNGQRPLFLLECQNCWIVCSEKEMGIWIAKRNNLSIVKEEEVPVQKMISFDLKDTSTYSVDEVEFKPYIPIYENKSHFYYDNFYGGTSSYDRDYSSTRKKSNVWGEYVWDEQAGTMVGANRTIRFQSGFVRKTSKLEYLEGDLLKIQLSTLPALNLNEFRDLWQIRYFPPPDVDILKLQHHRNLVGSIKAVADANGKKTIFVRDVGVYAGNVIALPNKVEEETCDCCGGPLGPGKGKAKIGEDWVPICKECLLEMSYS